MTPVFQRVVDPEQGDGWRAAVASVLDLSLDEVPEDINSGFVMEVFLRKRGLAALDLRGHNLRPRPEGFAGTGPWDVRRLVSYHYAAGAVAIASVPSQKYPGEWHAIVVQFTQQSEGWVQVLCVHDPNAGNGPYDMEATEIHALTFFLSGAP